MASMRRKALGGILRADSPSSLFGSAYAWRRKHRHDCIGDAPNFRRPGRACSRLSSSHREAAPPSRQSSTTRRRSSLSSSVSVLREPEERTDTSSTRPSTTSLRRQARGIKADTRRPSLRSAASLRGGRPGRRAEENFMRLRGTATHLHALTRAS